MNPSRKAKQRSPETAAEETDNLLNGVTRSASFYIEYTSGSVGLPGRDREMSVNARISFTGNKLKPPGACRVNPEIDEAAQYYIARLSI